jgi:hypothetical protein
MRLQTNRERSQSTHFCMMAIVAVEKIIRAYWQLNPPTISSSRTGPRVIRLRPNRRLPPIEVKPWCQEGYATCAGLYTRAWCVPLRGQGLKWSVPGYPTNPLRYTKPDLLHVLQGTHGITHQPVSRIA